MTPQPAPAPAPDNAVSAHTLAMIRLDEARARVDVDMAARRLLSERYRVGLETYGQILHQHNGRDMWRDLLEELADACAYVEMLVQQGEIGVDFARDLSRLYVAIVHEHLQSEQP